MSDPTKYADPAAAARRSDSAGGDARRRGPALLGAAAGVAVIALLAVVFLLLRGSGGEDTAAAPAPPAAQTPDETAPSAAPSAPAATVPPALRTKPVLTKGTGKVTTLGVKLLVRGTGAKVRKGQDLTFNYMLAKYADGKVIESSFDSGQPVTYPIGVGQLIKGWDQGLVGLPVGSRVQLDVPATLAYGPQQGDLRFIIDLLDAR
jgi:peptidylprolyl isomerase